MTCIRYRLHYNELGCFYNGIGHVEEKVALWQVDTVSIIQGDEEGETPILVVQLAECCMTDVLMSIVAFEVKINCSVCVLRVVGFITVVVVFTTG